jgi:hypothetical protein
MNWGNKLLLTFIVFVGGMSYLIYRSVNTNFELVDKDYYKNELQYQQVIDATKSANALSSAVQVRQANDGKIILELPEEMKDKIISGDIQFYCAYNSERDKKFELQLNDGVQLFNPKTVLPGNYTVRINWSSDGKKYFSEKPLTIL